MYMYMCTCTLHMYMYYTYKCTCVQIHVHVYMYLYRYTVHTLYVCTCINVLYITCTHIHVHCTYKTKRLIDYSLCQSVYIFKFVTMTKNKLDISGLCPYQQKYNYCSIELPFTKATMTLP